MSAKPAPVPGTAALESGRRVIEAEAEGLRQLARGLDESFAAAVAAISAMKRAQGGRLIVAGIGKSGHVASKLAATFASTGTPAYYVHAGEASHGDLGMVTAHDVVLLLSNSGESPELSDLIAYTRRFGITLIAMTANPQGALAQHADIKLLLPKVPEACPNGLAPTTSTTMMMALGDALAVALLEEMGLTKEQFKVFHPGGKLGQKLRLVRDLMHPLADMPLVAPADKMDKALLVMTGKNMGALVAVDDKNNLKGIITDGDLRRHMNPGLLEKTVADIMTPNPKSIESSALAAEALAMMLNGFKQPITCLTVMENGKLVGLLRVQTCLQAGVA